ncbi:MAG: deoxynucleoside kinase [Patescibacteria group bacterium]
MMEERALFTTAEIGEHEPQPRYLHFAVIGGIGVGKSELVHFLSQDFGLAVVEETHNENPYLPKFYEANPAQYAFNCQTFFLAVDAIKRKRARMGSRERSYIEDQGWEGDRIIELVQRQMGWIGREDHFSYLRGYAKIERDGLPRPDIFIGLVTDFTIVKERIEKRGRSMELTLLRQHPEYFKKVLEAFNKYISVLAKRHRVIVVDASRDFIRNFKERYRALNDIASYVTYYVNSPNQMNGRGPQGEKLLIPKYLQSR